MTGRPVHVFRCRLCGGHTVTVQLHAGEIPESIACRDRGFGECRGAADRVETPSNVPEPKWEWVCLHATQLERMQSDENAFVRAALEHAFLTLQSHRPEVADAAV